MFRGFTCPRFLAACRGVLLFTALTSAACSATSIIDASAAATAGSSKAMPSTAEESRQSAVPTLASSVPTSTAKVDVTRAPSAGRVPCIVVPQALCAEGELLRYTTAERGTFTAVGFRLDPGTPLYTPYPIRVGLTWAKYPPCETRPVQGTIASIGLDDIITSSFIGDFELTIDVSKALDLAVGERFASMTATGARSFGDYNLVVTVARRSPTGKTESAEDILKTIFPQAFGRGRSNDFAETTASRSCPPAVTNPQYFGPSPSPSLSGAP